MSDEITIEDLRKKIDDIDEKIMDLINQRAHYAKKIGEIKKQKKIPVLQENRERFVIEHITKLAREIPPINARLIWKEIMSACRQVQGGLNKVGYLGPEGTFSQQAALIYFAKGDTQFIPCDEKYQIFEEVEKGHFQYGIVPIENSLHGSVTDTIDLLIERNVKIYAELELPIVHNLIGLPDCDIDKITEIYSHPAVFAQVRTWLKRNIPRAKLIDMTSTAVAVKYVAEKKDPKIAAIGNEYAAEINDLKILAKGIQDDPSNYTRFIIISKKQQPPSGNDKTSLVFVTKHTPGALFNILRYFKEGNINLTKLESRPRKADKMSVWEYIFYVDFEGHADDVSDVLEKVKEQSIWMKILGSYPKSNVSIND